MYMRKNEIIPKEVLDSYQSVNFANEEHTIYVVSNWVDCKLKYNYVRVSDGTLILYKWCINAGEFINKTAIILCEDETYKIINEDGTCIYCSTAEVIHYYYGLFVVKYQTIEKELKDVLLDQKGSEIGTFDAIQNLDKEKLVGKHPEYFWVMKNGRYNFINSKGHFLLDEYCDGFGECDNKEFIHVWYYSKTSAWQKHKYIRIRDGEVITEGCFRKVTKIKHGLWRVENIYGYCNMLGYNHEFVFPSWHRSINVIILDETNRVCFLVTDKKEDEIVRYLYSPTGKKFIEVDRVIGVKAKYSECLINVEHNGKSFWVNHLTGEIVSNNKTES